MRPCGEGLEGHTHTHELANCDTCVPLWRTVADREHGIVYLSSYLMRNSCRFLVHCLQLQTGKMSVRGVYFNLAVADWKSRHTRDKVARGED